MFDPGLAASKSIGKCPSGESQFKTTEIISVISKHISKMSEKNSESKVLTISEFSNNDLRQSKAVYIGPSTAACSRET